MYFLGIDGGGTKTAGILSDSEGKVLRTGIGESSNIAVLGKQNLKNHLIKIIAGLLRNQPVDKISWATFGIAGSGRAKEKQMAMEAISEIGIQNFSLMTDAELLYYSIYESGQGILISAGTGSFCIIRNKQDELEQLGGWGYLLGDEGSGYDVGRKAIIQALTEDEGEENASKLTKALLLFYQVKHPKDLISTVHSATNPQNVVASSAKLVCEQALKGEPYATKIVDIAAESLLRLAVYATERIKTIRPYKIALSGGLLSEGSPVLQRFKIKAAEKKLEFEYLHPSMHPAAGAVLNSLTSAGEPISDSLTEQMKKVTFN